MLDKKIKYLSDYRLEKSKNLLKQAEILLENNMYDGSVNRSYYSVFNAIRSVLALVKLDSAKHTGVLSFFDKYFVNTNIFEKRFSKIAHSAFDVRQDNDYEDFYKPTKKEAESQLNDAKDFIKEIKQKRIELINGELPLPKIK